MSSFQLFSLQSPPSSSQSSEAEGEDGDSSSEAGGEVLREKNSQTIKTMSWNSYIRVISLPLPKVLSVWELSTRNILSGSGQLIQQLASFVPANFGHQMQSHQQLVSCAFPDLWRNRCGIPLILRGQSVEASIAARTMVEGGAVPKVTRQVRRS